MNQMAAAELDRLGGDPTGFTATQLTGAMVSEADLVLAATVELRSRVLEDSPRALRRTFTLREFAQIASMGDQGEPEGSGPAELVAHASTRRRLANAPELDVPDPIGRSGAFHRDVADLIEQACKAVAHAVGDALLRQEHASVERHSHHAPGEPQ